VVIAKFLFPFGLLVLNFGYKISEICHSSPEVGPGVHLDSIYGGTIHTLIEASFSKWPFNPRAAGSVPTGSKLLNQVKFIYSQAQLWPGN